MGPFGAFSEATWMFWWAFALIAILHSYRPAKTDDDQAAGGRTVPPRAVS